MVFIMLKPYRVVEQTDEFIIYEFRTVFLWILYLILSTLALGCFTDIIILLLLGGISMFIYFVLVSTQYISLNNKIKQASKEGSVEISGSKWSFKKPLRIKFPSKFL